MNPDPPKELSFAGEFLHGVDLKGRVTIPAEWRVALEGERYFLVTDSTRTFLHAMPPAEFAKLAEDVQEDTSFTAAQKAVFLRGFFSRVTQAATDRQGRILLPEKAREELGLKETIVLVGAFKTFKLFNRAAWEAQQKTDAEEYLRLAGHFGV